MARLPLTILTIEVFMKLLSKVNYTTKKHLGSTGRPVAIGVAAAAGLVTVGQKYGVELLQNNMAVAGFSFLLTAAVEGTLYFFGPDTAQNQQVAINTIDAVIKLNDKAYDAVKQVIENSVEKEAAEDLIKFFDTRRSADVGPLLPKHKRDEVKDSEQNANAEAVAEGNQDVA